MRHAVVAGLIIVSTLGGCSQVRPGPPPVAMPAPQPAVQPVPAPATSGSPAAPSAARPDATTPASTLEPTPTVHQAPAEPVTSSRAATDRPAATTAPGPASPGKAGTAATAGVVRAPAPPATQQTVAPATPPVTQQTVAPATPPATLAPAASPAPPSLDLASLEQRLRDTRAIGLFTKLSLKNQVDELLSQFRAYHHGDRTLPPSVLRQRYDGLLLKVISVLQNGDGQLATQVWSSREAIWGVLSDPAKFEKI